MTVDYEMRKAKARGRSRGTWSAHRRFGWVSANAWVEVAGVAEGRRQIEQEIEQHLRDLPSFAPGYARQIRAEIAGMRAFLKTASPSPELMKTFALLLPEAD